MLKGEAPNPINLPSGSRFHPRCPDAELDCRKLVPVLTATEPDHFMACGVVRRRLGEGFRGHLDEDDYQSAAGIYRRR